MVGTESGTQPVLNITVIRDPTLVILRKKFWIYTSVISPAKDGVFCFKRCDFLLIFP